MDPTVIPVHGTFDIARGRVLLRSRIAQQSWPSTLNVRAAALLSALGDLIIPLAVMDGGCLSIRADFCSQGPESGIKVSCQLPCDCLDDARMAHIVPHLERASDDLSIERRDHSVFITAYLYAR